jgi:hypothetical protein
MARFVTTIPSVWPPADAFAYMAAFENAAEWDPSVSEAHRDGDGFAVVARFGPRDVPLRYVVTESEAPHRVVLEARRPGFVSRDTITVEEGSVTYDASLLFSGLGRLADPIMQIVFNRVGRKAEASLRRILGTPR